MISPAAHAATSRADAPASPQAGKAADAANSGDFADFLASASPIVAEAPGNAVEMPQDAAVAVRQAGGKQGGKILPGALPEALPAGLVRIGDAAEATEAALPDAVPGEAAEAAAPDQPARDVPPGLAVATLLVPSHVTLPTPGAKSAATPGTASPRAAAERPVAATAASEQPTPGVAGHEGKPQPGAAPAAAPVADSAITLRQEFQAAAAAHKAEAPELRGNVTDVAPAVAADSQALPILPMPTAAPAMAPSLASAQPAALPADDFAALVDRLVAAREAVAPAVVHTAIAHAEFGQINLRFEQDAGGINVSMSSPDPDFARAVQATAAPAQASTTADGGADSQPRGGQQGHASGHGTFGAASDQSQSAPRQREARRDEPARANPRQPESEGDTPGAPRNGIFA